MPTTYRVNAPHVVSETIDGESIVINLQSGCYYSLRGTAMEIWTHIGPLGSTGAIAAALAGRYASPLEEIAGAVSSLVDRLRDEGLVVETDRQSGAGALAMGEAGAAQDGGPFTAPEFAKYQDLQDMLLADPIHEVGAGGWPTQLPPERRGDTASGEPSR